MTLDKVKVKLVGRRLVISIRLEPDGQLPTVNRAALRTEIQAFTQRSASAVRKPEATLRK